MILQINREMAGKLLPKYVDVYPKCSLGVAVQEGSTGGTRAISGCARGLAREYQRHRGWIPATDKIKNYE